ncbi:MAG TPA: S8 family serine peptidase [Verrucomicrobiae bacterium]
MKSRKGWRPINRLVTLLFTSSLLTVAQAAENWQFREPRETRYVSDATPMGLQGPAAATLEVYPEDNPAYRIEVTKGVVLRVRQAGKINEVLTKSSLVRVRQIDDRTLVLEAADAWTAAREAARLATLPEVEVAAPVFRRPMALHGPYAARSNDTFMPNQWHLENRDAEGDSGGADINIRAAWPLAKGAGVTISVVDEGVETAHPDLAGRTSGAPHRNFHVDTNNGDPMNLNLNFHGTAVAGLISADTDNSLGVAGAAPLAKLASWVIFNGSGAIADDGQLAAMFNYVPDQVYVQNHSWGGLANLLIEPSFVEALALSDATTAGRDGKGVVMVRAAGNHRLSNGNVNDDAYASSPDAIAVGAVRLDGRAASYGSRGASILVSAPGGDTDLKLMTTDLTGTKGYNQFSFTADQNNYAFGSAGFSGTSAATPQVSGIVALMLSANPELKVRDVQHILVQSARHINFADPAIQTNGAGFTTSDNVGFGIVDAGVAVKLAQSWSNQPPRTTVTRPPYIGGVAIPETATRLNILGPNVPVEIASIQAYPTDDGPRVDKPMTALPIVYVGYATNVVTEDVQGKIALIQRGPGRDSANPALTFNSKINRAAAAGAKFAVIFSDSNVVEQVYADVEFTSPIPAVYINREPGLALTNYLFNNPSATALLQVEQGTLTFTVPDQLVCEHVAIKLMMDDLNQTVRLRRSDLRITLTSPSGTISVLQAVNNSSSIGPVEWTYRTVQNFYEPSKGNWTLQITDEISEDTGLLTYAELIINGIPITDSDADGLDDGWEMTHFGNLAQRAKDDTDGDGWQNAREQVRGTDPTVNDEAFAINVSPWNANLLRLSWEGAAGTTYTARKFTGTAFTPTVLTNITGKFPVTELFLPYANTNSGFIMLERPAP